jgi:hypothetical protein
MSKAASKMHHMTPGERDMSCHSTRNNYIAAVEKQRAGGKSTQYVRYSTSDCETHN